MHSNFKILNQSGQIDFPFTLKGLLGPTTSSNTYKFSRILKIRSLEATKSFEKSFFFSPHTLNNILSLQVALKSSNFNTSGMFSFIYQVVSSRRPQVDLRFSS